MSVDLRNCPTNGGWDVQTSIDCCLETRPLFIGSIPGPKAGSGCHMLNSAGETAENPYAAGMVMFGNAFNVVYPGSGTGVGVSHYTGVIAARDALAAMV